eukprot:04140.XXX_75243_75365_1 [CDS] Oithona nana genome sequencing.
MNPGRGFLLILLHLVDAEFSIESIVQGFCRACDINSMTFG